MEASTLSPAQQKASPKLLASSLSDKCIRKIFGVDTESDKQGRLAPPTCQDAGVEIDQRRIKIDRRKFFVGDRFDLKN
ncbi:hypothetical protein ACTXT7_003809 [Hymenolepis weldensis]